MTREEKIKKIEKYCDPYDEARCGVCPLYEKYFVTCYINLTNVPDKSLDRI